MHIVSKWTGVPLNRMEQKEAQKLLNMEEELKEQVIGQDEAVIAISRALRRSRVLRGNIKQGDTLDVHAAGEQLAFKVDQPEQSEPANGSSLRIRG
jgi:hypothetical protein